MDNDTTVNRSKIIEDEMALIAAAMKSTRVRPVLLDKHNTERPRIKYTRAAVVSDGSRGGGLAAAAFSCGLHPEYPEGVDLYDVSNVDGVAFDEAKIGDNSLVYVFLDSSRHICSAQILSLMERIFSLAREFKNVRIIVSVLVPEPIGLPEGVEAVAEREYDYILETKSAMAGPAWDYAVAIHRICRKAVRDWGISVSVLRSVNMFGPMATGDFNEKIVQVVEDIFDRREVVITGDDHRRIFSVTQTSDIVTAAFWAVYNAVSGHEFNVVSHVLTMAKIKRVVFEFFKGELSLVDSCPAGLTYEWRCLSALKFKGTRWNKWQKGKLDLTSAVGRVACFIADRVFEYKKSRAVYEGKLRQIKSVEMDILREIDRICNKYGIKYFLAGGTLLGAVRNGESIPWDDDFDIGFLREDFDKFREACDKELGDRFVHTCYYNGTDSHYMVDKIRMRDTYFSTRYSSIHAVEDGVFIDCLVYDATYSNKVLAKIHDKVCGFLGNLVQAYWREYRRDEVKSKVRWLMIKTMELLSIDFYHRLYSAMISLRKGCKAPSCVIDSMGKHIGLGTIPFEGLQDVKRVSFDDGFMAPIPQDPTGYLVYDYGEGYLEPPPYCKQVAPHNFARIDLGKYLYCHDAEVNFRSVDHRGELFEKELTYE